MRPKYLNNKEDLKVMLDAIREAKEDFEGKARKEKLSDSSKELYDNCKEALIDAERYLDILTSDGKTEAEYDNAWFNLTRIKYGMKSTIDTIVNTGLMNATDEQLKADYKAQVDSLNRKLANDDERRLYRAQKKLRSALDLITLMECRQSYADIDTNLGEYNKKRDQFSSLVAGYTGDIPYEDIRDMDSTEKALKIKKEQLEKDKVYYSDKKKLKELKSAYDDAMNGGGYGQTSVYKQMEGFKAEADKRGSKIMAINDKITKIEEQIEKEVENASLESTARRKKELNAQIESQQTKLDEANKELSENTIGYSMERSELELLQNKGDRMRKEIKAAVENGTAKISDKVTDQMVVKMYNYIEVSLELDELNAEYLGKLHDLNVSEFGIPEDPKMMTNEQRKKQIESIIYGRTVGKQSEAVLKVYREANNRNVTMPIEMSKLFDEYMKKFEEIYQPTEKEKQEIKEKVQCPTDLFMFAQKAALDSMQYAGFMAFGKFSKPDETKIKGKDIQKIVDTLSRKYAAYNESASKSLGSKQSVMNVYKVRKTRAEIQADDVTRELNKLKKELDELNGGKITALRADKQKMLKEIEALQAEKTTYDATYNKFYDQYHPIKKNYEDFVDGLDRTQKELKSVNNEQATISKLKEDLINIHNASEMMIEAGNKVNKSFEFYNDDAHTQVGDADKAIYVRNALFQNAIDFVDSQHFAMKPDHNDSAEFKAMVASVKALIEHKPGEARPTAYMPIEKLKGMLDKVGEKAQAYLDKRNGDFIIKASEQRKYRMDYAKRMVKFAENFSNIFDRLAKSEKSTVERFLKFEKEFAAVNKNNNGMDNTFSLMKAVAMNRSKNAVNNSGNQPENNKKLEAGQIGLN